MTTQYLMIENRGEAEPESFTVLGASSSRGDEDAIGQFGSGAKHAILCALRAGLQLLIYCGSKIKILPQSQPQTIHGKVCERVCFRVNNRLEQSSMTLDFGSLDWTDAVPMMLRELISNALDSVGGVWSKINIEYVDQPRAKAGRTRVFVELTDEIREYVRNVHHYFLQVNDEQDQRLLEQDPDDCRFYRKGVLVRVVDGANSLYSYNCGDELPIDESRNLDTHRVAGFAAQMVSEDRSAVRRILQLLASGRTDFYEASFTYWWIDYETVCDVAKETYGADVVVTDNPVIASRARRKGVNVLLIENASGWSYSLGRGLPRAETVLSRADEEGLSTFEPSELLVENACLIWDRLDQLQLTGSKDFPMLYEFELPMNAGRQLCGYYDSQNDSVNIHRNYVDSWQVILEEFAHYLTGASDETRDFQDWAFRVAASVMKGGAE